MTKMTQQDRQKATRTARMTEGIQQEIPDDLVIFAEKTKGRIDKNFGEFMRKRGKLNISMVREMYPIIRDATHVSKMLNGTVQYGRVKQITKTFLAGVTVLSLIFYIPIQLGAETVLSWFIKESRIVGMGVTDFRVLFSTYIFLGLVLMAITLMQALGKASKASVLVLLRQIVLFVPLVLLVPRLGGLGINGVFLAPALTDLIVLVIAVFMLVLEFRSLTRLNNN